MRYIACPREMTEQGKPRQSQNLPKKAVRAGRLPLSDGAVLLSGNRAAWRASAGGRAAGALGERLLQAGDAPVEGGSTPTGDTSPDRAGAQRRVLQDLRRRAPLAWASPSTERRNLNAPAPSLAAGAPVVICRRAVTLTASPTLLQQTPPITPVRHRLVLC
jgi:hypothetical protein